jgi:hypothetical protein
MSPIVVLGGAGIIGRSSTLQLLATDKAPTAFAHPVEEEFADLLDYYGIEWRYEPHTFPLAWDERGAVAEAFTPDFYLPAEGLYVELTTMRPKLIRLKNRKIRRLLQLHPEIKIKLFNRRDLHLMRIKYGLPEREAGPAVVPDGDQEEK